MITRHEPGALHERHRAVALPRRADDLAALPPDHGRALALPVLRRRRRPPLGAARAARPARRGRAQRGAARARLVSREPRSAVSAVAAAAPSGLDRRGLGVLSFGHLSVDRRRAPCPRCCPSWSPIAATATPQSGALLLFSSIGSSFLQPLLGAFADRIRASWMMPVGTLLAAVGIALVGQFESYAATGAVLVIASIGVAMYHPEAVRFASYVSAAGGRQGTGMSMFAVGGLSGWALGPILTTPDRRPSSACAELRSWPSCRSPPPLLVAVNLRYFEGFRPTAAAGHLAARAIGRRERLARLHASPRPRARCAPARSSASRRSCRCTSGARSTRARASGNTAIAAMLAAGAFGTLARRPPLRPARLSPRRRLLALRVRAAGAARPGRAAARAVPADRALRAHLRDELLSDRRDRAAGAAAARRIRLGRDARAQHRHRLAREPAARRAGRQHVAAHRARRRRRAGGARGARLARCCRANRRERRVRRCARGRARRGRRARVRAARRPARPAVFTPFPGDLDPRVQSALIGAGISGLYGHQADVWEAARRGEHVCVSTGHGERQVARVHAARARGGVRAAVGARALPLPDQGAGAGSGARAARVRARPAAGGLRRRHAARAAPPRAPLREPDPHEPRHAARRHPAEPPALGGGADQPHARRDRRGAHLPRRLRLARLARAAPAAARLRALRLRAAVPARERDDREPRAGLRRAHRPRRAGRRPTTAPRARRAAWRSGTRPCSTRPRGRADPRWARPPGCSRR